MKLKFGFHLFFPTTALAIYKCMIEIIFIQQYLWVPSLSNKTFYDDDHDYAPYKCSSSSSASFIAFVTQFGLVGSELCFFIISYDLRLAYTNPFSSFQENKNFFIAIVVGISLATSFILLAMGPQVYGLSDLGLIWIQKRRESGSPNYPKAVLYYVITIAVFVYSLWANFRYNIDSEKGFSKTVSNRLSIMQRSKKFTLGYVGYGSLVFLMEFISYLTKSDAPIINDAPAYLLASRGMWGLMVILFSNRKELTWELLNPFHIRHQEERLKEDVALEKLLQQPHLNTALRAEILYFTTQGIMFAARDHQKNLNRKKALLNQQVQQQQQQVRIDEDDGENDAEYSLDRESCADVRYDMLAHPSSLSLWLRLFVVYVLLDQLLLL
jgi:hypothetical protein